MIVIIANASKLLAHPHLLQFMALSSGRQPTANPKIESIKFDT